MKQLSRGKSWPILLAVLLLLLAACGGAVDEAVEDTSETDTTSSADEESGDVEDEAIEEEEAMEEEPIDDGFSATGSEEDSGELPPTPDTSSKTGTVRATAEVVAAVVSSPTPPTNRSDTDQPVNSQQIDIVFVLDATGSMDSELNTLKAGLDEISVQLSRLPGTIAIRYGLVVYRDGAKSSSTQLFALTDSWPAFTQNITAVTALGGGDYAEDLSNGYYQAVTGMAWNPEANKLIILLGDAPPHQDSENEALLNEALAVAAAQGIKTFTVGSDGLNAAGITIYQEIAQTQNGRFLFISETPENSQLDVDSVQPLSNLPTLLVEVVREVLNE